MSVIDRRRFLALSASILAAPAYLRSTPALSENPDFTELRAAPTAAQLLPSKYGSTAVWAYGDSVPGPMVRVKAGDRVQRRFVNALPQSSAVHWHGIRIENAMDGAAGVTQSPVEADQTFDYDFVAPDPGTYWYHSHNRSWEQVARGLYGPLIVEDTSPWLGLDGAAVRELVLVLDDWYLDDAGQIDEASFGNLHEWAHAGRLGNVFTVNGQVKPDIPVRTGERLRLRIINAANARMFRPRLQDQEGTIIALDGAPTAPRALGELLLSPAQRADIVMDCAQQPGSKTPLQIDLGAGDMRDIATFTYSDASPIPATSADVRPLPSWASSANRKPALADAQHEELLMQGGAMGMMATARFKGVERPFRELMAARQVWVFNGVAGGDLKAGPDLDEPIFRATRGRTVKLTMRNETVFPHGIHLHGHHFTVLSDTSSDNQPGDVRDTITSWPRETLEIAFKADNPGRWLLHCHMLEHQASGMLSWFEVT